MTPDWTSPYGRVRLICGDCREWLPRLEGVNAIITDPPFSERTHSGHDQCAEGARGGYDSAIRRTLSYQAWSERDVWLFCEVAKPDGWLVVFTDHVLAPIYQTQMEHAGRYVFAPLPSFTPGRSVRLNGDGPCSWTDWLVVSRTAAQSTWGTLPGGYVNTPERRNGHMGGKPVGLMCRIIRDYSREDDLVCDPCMGGGATALGCLRTGRRFVGIELNRDYYEQAKDRIERELAQGTLPFAPEPRPVQEELM